MIKNRINYLSILMAIMIFTFLSIINAMFFNISTYVINNNHYLLGNTTNLSDNQIVDPGGVNNSKWSTDFVSVSKTIDGTDTEDYFDITLQVKTKKPVIEYLEDEAVAVVIVMDLSNSMNSSVAGSSSSYDNSKAKKASDAAGSFVQQFYDGSTDYPNNAIGAVGFNTNGISLVGMTNLPDQESVNTFNTTLSNGVRGVVRASGYDNSSTRFTNIEAGLKMARTMLESCTQKHKYIILFSDGLPTTYTTSTSSTNYTGYNPTSLKDGFNKNRSLSSGNYSDTGAKRAREVAMDLKNNGVTIYSIGVGLSTFKGSVNSNIPFGSSSTYTNLNGEKMLMNQLGRSVVDGTSTVENTFGNITDGKTNKNRWNEHKAEIYALDWEIRNNYNPENMATIHQYVLSETPPSGQPALFENWLKYGIGSGFYYDVNNNDGLSEAIDDIYSQLDTNVLSRRTTLWVTDDPMSTYESEALKEYIEFYGFFNSSGGLVNSLTGTHGVNNTNTASLDRTNMSEGVIKWDLKNSGYSVVDDDIYVYELKYRVRLKTDKQGFIKDVPYDSNGTTTLTYVIEENGTVSDPKTLNYPIPKVKGFLTDIKIKKTVSGLASGFSFTDENSNFEFVVSFKRQDNTEVENTFTYDKYDSSGDVISQNQSITSGGTFVLSDGQYVVIHNLFHDINWTVSESGKAGFVSSITNGNSSGTTVSSVPLTEVEYNNKAYQLKINKVDKDTSNPLEGVRFSLYSSYQDGVFSGLVTNMNGVLLKDLLTDANGIIDFGNLSFELGGSTTYYLVEEDTIDKYNILDNYVEIIVSESGIVAKYNNEPLQMTQTGSVFEVTVPNAKGIDLPLTGGRGTLIFKLLGFIIIMISLINYKFNNIKEKEKNKIMKKYFKILFTLLITLGIFGNVYADTTYTIEINNANDGHVYEAYQIFKGTLSNDGSTLSNIKWGSGIESSFAEANDANTYASGITTANAEAKAKELGSKLSATVAGTSGEISNGTYTISGLEPGYYLIKDRNTTQAGNYDAYTEYIVKLVGDVSVTPKTGKPTADKKIVEGTSDVIYSSKYAVGDEVNFKLTGTLPTNYAKYETYKYIFHDTLDAGLTLKANSIKVYVDGTEITENFVIDTNPTNGETFNVTFDNTKLITSITKDSVITVEYTATVNNNAVRGQAGNLNTLNIEFSNNLYTTETGKTTNIVTKVYVFDFIFKKVDSKTGEALNGAGFKLERLVDNDWVEWETITNTTGNTFTFEGLSVGKYRLTETTTPDKYNTMTPVEFEVTAQYDNNGLSSLAGTKFNFTANLTAGTLTTDVQNVKGIELPLTGGMGTVVFTVVGLSLMGIAAIGIFKNKNKEEK